MSGSHTSSFGSGLCDVPGVAPSLRDAQRRHLKAAAGHRCKPGAPAATPFPWSFVELFSFRGFFQPIALGTIFMERASACGSQLASCRTFGSGFLGHSTRGSLPAAPSNVRSSKLYDARRKTSCSMVGLLSGYHQPEVPSLGNTA